MKLVKTSDKPTSFKMYVYNKISKKEEVRYYDCEYDLFRAYRQLKIINSNLVVLNIEYY